MNKLAESLDYFEKLAVGANICQATKKASTALVRNIRKGLVSVPDIRRAAAAMPANSFRNITAHGGGKDSLNALGSGQFNLADLVVGNFKRDMPEPWLVNPGTPPLSMTERLKARYLPKQIHTPRVPVAPQQNSPDVSGLFVQKMPTRYDAASSMNSSPLNASARMQQRYHAEANQSLNLNQAGLETAYQPGSQPVPPIAPAIYTDHRGQFSRVGNLTPDNNIDNFVQNFKLHDVHEGNLGPRGQILDYLQDPEKGGKLDWHLPLISPERADQSRGTGLMSPEFWGKSTLGNLKASLKEVGTTRGAQMLRSANRSNNDVRRFWNKPQQQPEILKQVNTRLLGEHQALAGQSWQDMEEYNNNLDFYKRLSAAGRGAKVAPEHLKLQQHPAVKRYFSQNTPLATH